MNPDLRTMAHRVLREAQKVLEQTGQVTAVFLVQQKNGEFLRFDLPREMGELMNSGDAKDAIFGFVREYIAAHQATGAIFVTEAWVTRGLGKGEGKPDKEEFLRLYRELGGDALVERGLARRLEVIIVTAQNADQVITLTAPFERDPRLKLVSFAPVEEQKFPQAQFFGRQKMFGDLRKENLS